MPPTGHQPVQPITTTACLVAKAQPTTPFAQPRCQLDQKLGTVLENPDLADLAAAAALGNSYTDRRLVHIQSDIGGSIHQARLPCMRLCAGHPAQPSTFCMSRDGPPITQRTSGLRVSDEPASSREKAHWRQFSLVIAEPIPIAVVLSQQDV